MRLRKGFLGGISCLLLICGLAGTARAKSVYAITKHSQSTIQTYDIQSDQLVYQERIEPDTTGAVGLACDTDSETLFTTYDGEDGIGIIDIRTLEEIDFITDDVDEFAGIVFDEANGKLLAMKRQGRFLSIYDYNREEKKLTFDKTKVLENIDPFPKGAYGIYLDDIEQRLYVTDNTNIVRFYDASDPDFEYIGSIAVTAPGEDEYKAVGIAVYNDGEGTKYLYTGGYSHTNDHEYLVRTALPDPNVTGGFIPVNVGTNVAGLSVDSDTGFLYITTVGNESSIRVYDPLNWPTDPCEVTPTQTITGDNISGPAGIVVGSQYKTATPGLHFDKTARVENDYDCVLPEDINEDKDEITYEISYWNEEDDENEPNYLGPLDVVITDWLSNDVNFVSADPCDTGQYDPIEHTYTWDITLQPSDKGTLTLIVQVREWADPSGTIANFVEIESEKYYTTAQTSTGVCCFGPDIIYVDCTFGDPNEGNGTSWELAYRDLQDGLSRAAKGCGDEIWVAGGIYKAKAPFDMVDDVEVYGGFAGDETIRDDRDYADNKTYLTGDLDSDGDGDRDNVVMADNTVSSTAVLDGFIITKSTQAGIRCNGADPAIKHCAIIDNENDGLYCNGADPSINNCVIMDNGGDGIDLVGNSSPSAVKNCWICRNGTGGEGDGIYFGNPDSATVVRNNTIADNSNVGVYQHAGTYADISDCIIWGNQIQLDLDDKYMPTYSCIQDSNDVNPYHNINSNPYFAYTDPNLADYHLDPCSPCVDAGDPCDSYDGELDIDGDERVLNGDDYSPDNGRVDMGADEVACDDIYNSLDWNIDAIVDLGDLIILANAWLSDPCADNWDYRCDLDSDNFVNLVDFAAFGVEWPWQPCWASSGTGIWMMMGAGGSMGRMMGAEFMLMAEIPTAKTPAEQQISEAPSEPDVAEQIEQIKYFLDWLSEIKDEIDEDTWLNLTGSLEEMLKDLQGD